MFHKLLHTRKSTRSKTNKTTSIETSIDYPNKSSHLIKECLSHQRLTDVIPQTTTSSITVNTATKDEEKKYYTGLVSNNGSGNSNGNISTRVQVAQCKIYGFGTKRDVKEGLRELLSLKNYREAHYPLGCYYHDIADLKNALRWFEKCNDPMSNYRIALLCLDSEPDKALHYMSQSAYTGNKYAQFMLGVYYEHGILVKQSRIEAKTWYERSANQEFAEAQTALANLLLNEISAVDKMKDTYQIEEALDWLFKAESQGNASAFIRLGSLHEEGILVQGDDRKAINYYKKATLVPLVSDSVRSLAHYLIGINYRLGDLGLEQDNEIAFFHLTKSSKLGYAPAQRALGMMYAEGIGTPKDPNKSYALFESAASKGDTRSLYLMASTTLSGPQVVIDLYKKAARLGSISAQLSLAQYYQHVEQHAVAFEWFEKASKSTPAKHRHPRHISILDFSVGFLAQRNTARLMVARYRYNGWGNVEKQTSWAFKEFKALSDEDFSDAFYWLAAWYEEIDNNLDLAFHYYKKGAVAGDVDCQFQIAYLLSNGYRNKEWKLIKDIEEGFFWYTNAANRGHITAQYCLGLFYENGLLVEVDVNKTIYWYTLAAENNMTLAMVRLARLLEDTQEAVHWLKKAIAIGDLSALRELATFYRNGLINEEGDAQKKAFDLFQEAANQGDPMSWHALSKFYEPNTEELTNSVVPVNFEMVISCLKKAEELGYPVAGLDLADVLRTNNMLKEAFDVYNRLTETHALDSIIGWNARLKLARNVIYEDWGSSTDQLRAYSWLINMQSAKTDSDVPLIYEMLGYCAEFGIGTPVNRKQSLQWYETCSKVEGDDWAIQRSLCRLVKDAMDKKRYKTAFEYLERIKPYLDDMCKVSEDANMQSCRMKYFIGYMLKYGLHIEKNEDLAIDYFADSADGGDLDAVYELGMSLIPIDEDEAKHRLEEGAMEGHAGCMRLLAIIMISEENSQSLYDEEEDEYNGGAEILRLLNLAIRLHDVEAMYQLAQIYENGLGTTVNKDMEKALEMYKLAAESGHELSTIKAGEILGNVLGKHEEAILYLQKAKESYNNTKAKVILLSYSFQGFNSPSGKTFDDAHNFLLLQTIINEGMEVMSNSANESGSINHSHHNGEDQLSMEKSGLGLAFHIMGQCHELGRGTPVNLNRAKEWYHRSATISQHIEAMWRLGIIYSTLEDNYVNALEWYRNAAEKGRHRDALYQIGLFHLQGLGQLERNVVAAQKYFTKASGQGHSLATYELARIMWNYCHNYLYGYELYKVACRMHVPDALRELGHLHHTGFSTHGIVIVEQNFKHAFAYYCEAAQKGDPTSALMVGNYFEEGYLTNDLDQDYELALQWYESAYRLNGGALAELAIGKVKHTMANAIQNPTEAEDMREEAFVWFESASNNPEDLNQQTFARMMVALYYLNGWGHKDQDAETGFEMLLSIAESGSCLAFVSIARCYEEGIGTKHDLQKALDYWQMAADMNDQKALIHLAKIYEQAEKNDEEATELYLYRKHMLGSGSEEHNTSRHSNTDSIPSPSSSITLNSLAIVN